MTSYQTIYDAFLAKVLEDDWGFEMPTEDILADQRSILESALPFFKSPRYSLARTDDGFTADFDTDTIQMVANFMKQEWLDRTVNSWENVKGQYEERDFSQANLLDKFIKLLDRTEKKVERLQQSYGRLRQQPDGTKKPYDYSKFAGGE